MKTYDVIIIGGGPAAIVTGITVKKFFNKKSVGEIINIISLAIQKSITVFELVSFQIGTHPLLTSSPVNNPIIRAAEELVYKISYTNE